MNRIHHVLALSVAGMNVEVILPPIAFGNGMGYLHSLRGIPVFC
jgi:hypothetical protein